MYNVLQTDIFAEWLNDLRDKAARYRIGICIKRIENGNLGDHRTVGDGVSEIRLAFGPGYRLYYTMRGREIIILLCGGDKSSQQRDRDVSISFKFIIIAYITPIAFSLFLC